MFITATIISVVFFIVKFIEMRFEEKEGKPFKILIKDSLFVYFSVVAGLFVLDQIKPVMEDGGGIGIGGEKIPVSIFLDNPGF